jgi:colanic acid biosynthesis protein WcaH
MIPDHLYREIISVLPIACVDVVIRNAAGKVLLARRKNEPLKDQWWVVGGRIQSGESARQACIRKTFEEAGLEIDELQFLGFYEDVFDKNSFDVAKPYHTLSLVFEARVTAAQTIHLDSQHSEWAWFDALPDRFTISTQNALLSQLDKK